MSNIASNAPSPVTIGDQTWSPLPKSRIVYVPFVCDMVGTVAQAAGAARQVLDKFKIHPGDSTEVLNLISTIEEWATSQQSMNLLDLSGDTAARLLCDIANVSTLDDLDRGKLLSGKGADRRMTLAEWELHTQQGRHQAHLALYTLVLMRGATILLHRHRWRGVRLLNDSLAAGLPEMPNKAGLENRKSRPVIDEEIMLCRLLLEINLAEGAPPRPALTYLVSENGVRGIESTTLDTGDLYPSDNPREVRSPGAWDFGARTVDLTSYSVSVLPQLLAQLRPGVQPLTYTGSAPGQLSATSSVTGVLMRHLRRAGIRDKMVTPKSINFWRPMHALLSSGDIAAARRYHGGATVNLLTDLRLVTDERLASTDREVELRRQSDNSSVAFVSTAEYNDMSMTRRDGRAKAREQRTEREARCERQRQEQRRQELLQELLQDEHHQALWKEAKRRKKKERKKVKVAL